MEVNAELWKILGSGALGLLFLKEALDFIGKFTGKSKGYEFKGLELLAKSMQTMTERHDDRWQAMVTQIASVERQQVAALQQQTQVIDRLADSMERLDSKLGADFPCKLQAEQNSNGSGKFQARR